MSNKGVYLGITNSGFLKTITINRKGSIHGNTTQIKKYQSVDKSYTQFIKENIDIIRPKKELYRIVDEQLDKYNYFNDNMYKRIFLQMLNDETQSNCFSQSDSVLRSSYNFDLERFEEAYNIFEKYKDSNSQETGDLLNIIYQILLFKLRNEFKELEYIKEDSQFILNGNLFKLNSEIAAETLMESLCNLEKEYKDIECNVNFQGKMDTIKELNIKIDKVNVKNINIVNKNNIEFNLIIHGMAKCIKFENSTQTFQWIKF